MDDPRFLAVRVGDLVAVRNTGDWWAGQVIHAEGGARCNPLTAPGFCTTKLLEPTGPQEEQPEQQ